MRFGNISVNKWCSFWSNSYVFFFRAPFDCVHECRINWPRYSVRAFEHGNEVKGMHVSRISIAPEWCSERNVWRAHGVDVTADRAVGAYAHRPERASDLFILKVKLWNKHKYAVDAIINTLVHTHTHSIFDFIYPYTRYTSMTLGMHFHSSAFKRYLIRFGLRQKKKTEKNKQEKERRRAVEKGKINFVSNRSSAQLVSLVCVNASTCAAPRWHWQGVSDIGTTHRPQTVMTSKPHRTQKKAKEKKKITAVCILSSDDTIKLIDLNKNNTIFYRLRSIANGERTAQKNEHTTTTATTKSHATKFIIFNGALLLGILIQSQLL